MLVETPDLDDLEVRARLGNVGEWDDAYCFDETDVLALVEYARSLESRLGIKRRSEGEPVRFFGGPWDGKVSTLKWGRQVFVDDEDGEQVRYWREEYGMVDRPPEELGMFNPKHRPGDTAWCFVASKMDAVDVEHMLAGVMVLASLPLTVCSS